MSGANGRPGRPLADRPPPVASKGDLPGLRPILLFLAFSHGWTWALWWGAAALGPSVWEPPATFLLYLGGAGVFLAALAMTAVTGGRRALSDLALRTVDPRRIGAAWWGVALLLVPLLTCLAGGIAWGLGLHPAPFDLGAAWDRVLHPGAFLAWAFFILVVGPLPEEIGWRGALLDRLQDRWSALVATLLVALAWWSWHLPLTHLPGYFDAFAREAPSPFEYLQGILPAALLYTWVYNNTNRSVLAVIVLHFMHNFTGEFLGMTDPVRSVRLLLEWGTALLVLAAWGPRTLRGRRGPASVP